MLFNRKIRTKLPAFPINEESKDQKDTRKHHDKRKATQKKYFDKRRKSAIKTIEVGDQVLVKQEKSTTKPPFNPLPLKVISVQGNRVSLTDGDKVITRDKNYLKKVHSRPNSLIPSWERNVRFNTNPRSEGSGYEVSSDEADDQNSACEDSQQANDEVSSENVLDGTEDTNHVPAEQTSPVRLTDDMAAHMEHLFAQAERTLQDSDATSSRPVTRSAGRSLQWNNQMGSKDVLVEESLDD